jgi:hypothetical protein
MGIKAIDKNPSRLLPQAIPRREYIAFAKSGNAAPKDDLTRSFDAKTSAT